MGTRDDLVQAIYNGKASVDNWNTDVYSSPATWGGSSVSQDDYATIRDMLKGYARDPKIDEQLAKGRKQISSFKVTKNV